MYHGRLLTEGRQHNKGEVVVCCHKHRLTRVCGILCLMTFGVGGTAHHRLFKPASIPVGADRNIKIVELGICQGFVGVETYNNAAGLIFDGRDARCIDLFCFFLARARSGGRVPVIVIQDKVAVQVVFIISVHAVGGLKITRRGVANAEARRIFNNDPGKQQA